MIGQATAPFTVAGIDAYRGGWVMAVVGSDPAADSRLVMAADIAELLDQCRAESVTVVGVDMPIGFAVDGDREADRLARKRLRHRASTLFTTPAHAVLDTGDWESASAANRKAAGKGLSKQAFHLLPGCREVRAAIVPSDQPWCSEVHPESSFAAMNDGEPLEAKHRADGHAQRFQLITELVAADALSVLGTSAAPLIDALDAYAAAWTARRLAQGSADILGDGTDPDGYALTIAV